MELIIKYDSIGGRSARFWGGSDFGSELVELGSGRTKTVGRTRTDTKREPTLEAEHPPEPGSAPFGSADHTNPQNINRFAIEPRTRTDEPCLENWGVQS